MDSPFDDLEYAKLVSSCMDDCYCCTDCASDVPCAGVMAGGLCDRMCRCRDDDWDDTSFEEVDE